MALKNIKYKLACKIGSLKKRNDKLKAKVGINNIKLRAMYEKLKEL